MRDGLAIAAATNAAAIAIHDGDLAAARSAHQTARQAARPGSDLRLRAAATHTFLLRATGDPAAAVPVGRDLARQLVARFGATDRRTLAAHGDLAVTLHEAGECLTGRQILHRTAELVRSTYGPDDPLRVRMRDRLADLTRECCPPAGIGAESADTVADHTCGQPNAAASLSVVDLFVDFVDLGDPSPAAGFGGIEAHDSEVPPWADRPTAGFPSVPIAAGLRPTWVVAAPPKPISAPHPIGATSTVGVAGHGGAGRPVTHSRATFARMRRSATYDCPQVTATASSARTTDGE